MGFRLDIAELAFFMNSGIQLDLNPPSVITVVEVLDMAIFLAFSL